MSAEHEEQAFRQNLERIRGVPEVGAAPPALRARIEGLVEASGQGGAGTANTGNTVNEWYKKPHSAPSDAVREPQGVAMSRLQSCTKCGAQFDVTSFAPGQQFSCGACGAVLTAHQGERAAAKPAVQGRTPGSRRPATAGRTPGAGKPNVRSSTPPSGRAGAAGSSVAGRSVGGSSVAGRSVAGSSVGAAKGRGPQYRPPQREKGAAASTPARGVPAARAADRPARGAKAARGGRRTAREGYDPSAKKGSPALLLGGAALLVAIILVVVFVGGGKDEQGGGSGDAPPMASGGPGTPGASNGGTREADTIASLRAELRDTNLRRASEYHAFADRFLAVGGEDGKAQAERLYQELIEQVAPDDTVARKALGYTDFQADILGRVLEPMGDPIPEEVSFRRGYPFLDAVVRFNEKRWLQDEDEIALAKKAVAEMNEHVHKLATDHIYRAGDKIRGNIAADRLLKDYNYETRWAAPYLICYSSKERLSEFDLLKEDDYKERRRMREKMAEKRKEWTRTLDEKEALYTQLYQEWMRRYADKFGLKNLTDEYGGREDYGSYKSFMDGVPLVIWIFSDREAFQHYHNEVKGEPIPAFAAGYFVPDTGWVYLFDETDSNTDRVFEINKNLHEGTHQLEHWFTRQKNRWREPNFAQTAFSEGIAEYFGAVEMDKKRKLTWTGVNQTRLRNMQQVAAQFKESGRELPVYPLKELAKSERYSEIVNYGVSNMPGLGQGGAMGLFYQQSWSMVYFLNTYKNGKYREQFLQYLDSVLSGETGFGQGLQAFKRIFKIRDEEDWEDIETEWKNFVLKDLLSMTVPEYTPPKRTDWD